MQAGLFAIVEVQLLSFVKNDANFHQRSIENSAKHTLLIFTYLALFFSVSVAVSGLILMDDFGELPVRASRKWDLNQQDLFDGGSLDQLQRYGAKRSWTWLMRLCELSCALLVPPFPHHRSHRGVFPHFWNHFVGHTAALIRVVGRAQLG